MIPQPQMMGQLPLEHVTPGPVFEKIGVDYAGPFLVKYGMVYKPTLVKAYMCIFVSLAVHLEAVSDLTSEAFIVALRRFITCRGHPSLIWSDKGTNFVGANRQLKELHDFLAQQKTSSQNSALQGTWSGVSSQSIVPTLVDCGKRELRVSSLTSDA